MSCMTMARYLSMRKRAIKPFNRRAILEESWSSAWRIVGLAAIRQDFNSVYSHDLANAQYRSAVDKEIPRALDASAMVKPAKYRSFTNSAFSALAAARRVSASSKAKR